MKPTIKPAIELFYVIRNKRQIKSQDSEDRGGFFAVWVTIQSVISNSRLNLYFQTFDGDPFPKIKKKLNKTKTAELCATQRHDAPRHCMPLNFLLRHAPKKHRTSDRIIIRPFFCTLFDF